MKKYIVLIFSLVIIGLTGCMGNPASDPTIGNQEVSQEENNNQGAGETENDGADEAQDASGSNGAEVTEPDSSSGNETEPATETGDEPSDNESTDEQNEFLDQFYGIWTHIDQSDVTMELQNGIELIGVENGQLMSQSEFTVIEENPEERYIIVEGSRETISYDETTEKIDYTSKIILQDDGNKLLYIYDYLNTQVESEWIR